MDNYDKYDLLIDFIDGEITPEQEELLFFNLSVDEELRGKMKQMLVVDSTIQSNPAYFAPSAVSTGKIFSTLGFAVPGSPPSSLPVRLSNRIANLMKKYSQGLIGALSVSVVMLLIYLAFLNGNSDKNEEFADSTNYSRVIDLTNSNIPPVVNSEEIDIENEQLYEKSAFASNSTNQKKSSVQNSLGNGVANNAIDENSSIANLENRNERNYANIEKSNFSLNFGANPITRESLNSPIIIESFKINNNNFEELSKISLEIRGAQSRSISKQTIDPAEYALFNNYAATIFYKVADNFKVGLDIRQENYFQEFSSQLIDGGTVTYEQFPNFTTFSAALRYNYAEIGKFSPFVQANFGLNRGGAVNRLFAGTEFELYNNLSFTLGVEYSAMFYKYQSTNYNTGNFGLLYGLRYNF